MSTACYIAFAFFFCSSYISCIHVSLPSPITSMLAFQVEHIVLGWSGCYVPPHVLLPCDDGVWAWLCLIFYFVYVLNLLWWFCTFISLCFLQTEKKIAKEKRKTLLTWSRDIIGIWGRRSDGEVKFIWAVLNFELTCRIWVGPESIHKILSNSSSSLALWFLREPSLNM